MKISHPVEHGYLEQKEELARMVNSKLVKTYSYEMLATIVGFELKAWLLELNAVYTTLLNFASLMKLRWQGFSKEAERVFLLEVTQNRLVIRQ